MATIKHDSHLYKPLKYVDILTDYGFKLLFGDKELLMGFLNALFETDGKVVTSVRYLGKEVMSVTRVGRTIYYDLLCKINGEEDVIIEMQYRSQETFVERSFYYMAQSLMHQGDGKSKWTYKMYPVYGIFLMNFHLPVKGAPKKVVNEVVPVFKGTTVEVTNKFRMFFIDLLNFEKTKESELESLFDWWIFSIKNMGRISYRPNVVKPLERLYSRAEVAAMNPRQYREYERSLKATRDAYSIAVTERNERKRIREEARTEGLAEGRAEGREVGLAEGRAEGREVGLAEGRAEGRVEGEKEGAKNANIATARSMKADGMSVDVIAKYTGLTPDEIAKL